MRRNDPDRSAGLWLLSFGAAAGAVLCGRFGWLPALLGGGLAALAYRLRLQKGRLPAAVRAAPTSLSCIPRPPAASCWNCARETKSGLTFVFTVYVYIAYAVYGR